MQWAGRVVLGLWVALSVLTWAPRFGEAADATVTGTGRFVFQKLVHGQWVEIGIRRARVEMCDDDQVLGCQLMAVGQTDDDGYFSVTGRAGDFFGDLPDPPVKVIAQSDAATVEDTAVRWDLLLPVGAPLRPDQRIDGRLRDHLHGDGLRLHHRGRCRRPEGCLGSPQPGRRSPPLHADVHAGHSGSRRALGQGAVARGSDGVRPARLVLGERTINIGPIIPRERFFMKQYGHHVLQHFADYPVANFNNGVCDDQVDPFGVETGRCRWHAENGAIHWTEGFPIFLSEVLTRFWGCEGFEGFNIGSGPHPHPDTNFNLVPEVTATILWNTLGWATALGETVGMDADGNNHDANNSKDNLSVGFETIWDAIINFDPASSDPAHNHPQTIGEFWLAFTFLNPDYANRLSAVYHESHVTMLAANLEAIWVGGAPEVVYPGSTLTIDNITANSGYVSVGEPSITQFYLSTDLVLGSGDILIGQRTVPNVLPGPDRAASGPSVRIVERPVTPSVPTGLAGCGKSQGTTVRNSCRESVSRPAEGARAIGHVARRGPSRVLRPRRRVMAAGRRARWPAAPSWRRSRPGQIPDPHQVVHGQGEGEHPSDPAHAAMAHLATQPDRLGPAEDLFHPLALLLTDGVAGMAGGAAIDGTAPAGGVLRDMRGDAAAPRSAATKPAVS